MRDDLRDAGIDAPDSLTSVSHDLIDFWQRPDLLFSQTCGYPFRHVLHDRVSLVGSPDHALPGCPPGYYRSALVVRRDDPRDSLAAFAGAPFAFNDHLSQSGYAAPITMAEAGGILLGPGRVSGSHLHSARLVLAGAADIAALDAVSWRHMTHFDDWTRHLRVLDWTSPTPGLPFITAAHDLAPRITAALGRAIAALPLALASHLALKGLVTIGAEDYLQVPKPASGLAGASDPLGP